MNLLSVDEDDVANSELDIEALHERYLAERDRRLRPEGVGQYVRLDVDSEYVADPFSEPIEREPISKDVDVVILGGGFSGLIAGGLLRKQGDASLAIIEDGGDFGGTWYWNRYPGARCDIESYIYLPMIEDVGVIPSERYATTTEIFEHARRLGRHFDLYKDALFQTRLTETMWDEEANRWDVRTDRGDVLRARFLILGSGQLLSRPKLPGIPGLDSFAGHTFHTSRWDYEYTGGDTAGALDGLRDKRVAIIGTGATAVQAIPFLAEDAEHLYVFQRTPSIIDYRGNRPTDPKWAASLQPGWQNERMLNFDHMIEGRQPSEILVNDQWNQVWRRPAFSNLPPEERAQATVKFDYLQMDRIRRRIDSIVEDPTTAEALKPYYSRFCKRPCFNDEYLPAFNRPNVTLVDTQGRGADRATERGLVFDGVEYELDCIIFATGFESFAKTPSQAGRYNVIGRNGRTLDEKWGKSFASLHGMAAEGFPNAFILGSSRQSASSFNIPHRILRQAEHAVAVIYRSLESGAGWIEVTPEAERAWAEVVKSVHSRGDIDTMMRECTPGYYNNEGNLNGEIPVIAAGYGGGTLAFIRELEEWRECRMERDLLSDTSPLKTGV